MDRSRTCTKRPLLYVAADWLLYLGELPALAPHRHPVPVLCVGLDGPFLAAGQPVETLVVGADAPAPAMAFAGTRMGFVFLTPLHRGHQALLQLAAAGEAAPLEPWRRELTQLHEQAPSLAEAAARLGRCLPGSREEPDPRVSEVLARLAAEPAAALDGLAGAVGLSPRRLRHLFTAGTGSTPRRLRLWMRMLAAARRLAAGDSLTQAAAEAGFSDSAHLSRSFREFFGLNPAAVVATAGRLSIRCDPGH